MFNWRSIFAIAALILGLMATACGGTDSSPPDSAGGTGGTATSGGTGGNDDGEVEAVKGDDGTWTCPVGAQKADAPSCIRTEPSTTPPDDAGPTEDDCPNLDGQICHGDGMDECTWHAVEGTCSFQCTWGGGLMPYDIEESPEGARAYQEACNIEL